jgi:4-oxalomesaconate hydratase
MSSDPAETPSAPPAAGAIALTIGGAAAPVEYSTDLGRRRGVQAKRDSGPNPGLASETWTEAYRRAYPHVTTTLA